MQLFHVRHRDICTAKTNSVDVRTCAGTFRHEENRERLQFVDTMAPGKIGRKIEGEERGYVAGLK